MSCFLPPTTLPLPSPSPSFPDSLLHSYANHCDVSASTLERDYMGLGGTLLCDISNDHSMTCNSTAREVSPPLFFNTASVLHGADLCGSHLKLAPPGSSDDDDDDDNLVNDGETLTGNVGWPPVSSYRKTISRSISVKLPCNVEVPSTMIVPTAPTNDTSKLDAFNRTRRNANLSSIMKPVTIHQIPKASWIKVSMDGTPIMRKLNLQNMQGYEQLFMELHKLFNFYNGYLSCEVGKGSYPKDMNGFDCVLTYEDKEGDWMLLGDMPWQTFTESATRIRIMKKVK